MQCFSVPGHDSMHCRCNGCAWLKLNEDMSQKPVGRDQKISTNKSEINTVTATCFLSTTDFGHYQTDKQQPPAVQHSAAPPTPNIEDAFDTDADLTQLQ